MYFSGVFDQLKKLKKVYLSGNICANKQYTDINQLQHDIKINCDKANDVIQYEIENKITNAMTVMRTECQQKYNVIRDDATKIIVDDNKPRNIWEKGTITKVYPDKEGQVRSADVKVPSNPDY